METTIVNARYIGIATTKKQIGIYIISNSYNCGFYHVIDYNVKTLIDFLIQYQNKFNCKIVTCGISRGSLSDLHVKLWKDLDIISGPVFVKGTLEEKACSAARKCYHWSSHDITPGIPMICIGKNHRVAVDCKFKIAELQDYKTFTDPDVWKEIIDLSKKVNDQNKSIVFFNSTPRGGGVAIIRHSMIRFMKLLGIDARWFVMKPNPTVFEITKKKIHNVLQGVSNEPLTEEDKCIFTEWSQSNVIENWNESLNASIIVIDDPQPSRMIPYLKKLNPKTKFIYRSHIQLRSDLIDTPGTTQFYTWNYLWENIKLCDIFISHPIPEFIPTCVLQSNLQLVKLPACTDPIDGLNKHINSLDYYQQLFNKIALEQINKKVDFSKQYFIQIARFDPSKGIPDLVKAFHLFKTQNVNDTQLIITGHGSIDDPEGSVIYKEIIHQISELPLEISKDIFAVLLPSHDQLLNSILQNSFVAFQLSIREGFEIKVSESLLKGKPVIAYSTGGIPLQVKNNFDGFLVETGNFTKVSELMTRITTDRSLFDRLSKNAKEFDRNWVLTPTCSLSYIKQLIE
jgi:glycosyltransferase involved in cell wall biosynthesis